MKPLSLIIGMGIGELYKTVLEQLDHTIVTVDSDPNKLADYNTVEQALESYDQFDTVHICTPNYTHESIAYLVAPKAKIVFIEKPGLITADAWDKLVDSHPNTRIMMVKNNQYRDEIDELKVLAEASIIINVNWINHDRVPNPGTWFTNKELAFGGVSRDLVPHLLSLWIALDNNYDEANRVRKDVKQRWQLSDITNTNYGTVDKDGVYNVDDYCRLGFFGEETMWTFTADWRSLNGDDIQIEFVLDGDKKISKPLGLCPESAYKKMIETAIANIDDTVFWNDQHYQDQWIHKKIEKL